MDVKITENKRYRLVLTAAAAAATRVGRETRLHQVVFWPLLLHGGMCTLTPTVSLKNSESNRSDKHPTDKEKRKIHAAQATIKTGNVITCLQQEGLWEVSTDNCTLDHTDDMARLQNGSAGKQNHDARFNQLFKHLSQKSQAQMALVLSSTTYLERNVNPLQLSRN